METAAKPGLEEVIATDTAICTIDGERGLLIYQGYDVRDLAKQCTFEEVAHLLWTGELPNQAQLEETTQRLAAHRPISVELRHVMDDFPRSAPPMSALRTAVSSLGLFDPRAESDARQTNLEMAIELTAQTATIVAAFHRLRQGLEPLAPDTRLPHATDFGRMVTGKMPDGVAEKAMDVALILHAEHEFNASTFAARVTASTLADMYSAASSALGALRGPLHGGANQQVMRMLEEIGTPSRAEEHIVGLLERKERVMGFGHRVYRNSEDPRAVIMRDWCRCLCEELGERWADIQAIIEQVMWERKGLRCNVDFYSAPVYYMLGIPADLFVPVFAVSRMVGWTAHILEQYQHNRLIRPRANYIGPSDREVKPLRER